MSDPHSSARPKVQRSRRRHAWLTQAGYFLLAAFLVGWEVQEGHIYQSSSCDLRTTQPSESMFMQPLYHTVLQMARLKDSQQVSMVAIDADLAPVQANVCLGRAFMSDLLQMIAAERPAVIAIDKFYGSDSCPGDPGDTAQLLATIAALNAQNIKVVVGASTAKPSSGDNSKSCLAVSPQLFTPIPDPGCPRHCSRPAMASNGPATVYVGLTRMNEDPLKIPLVWPVYESPKSTQLAQDRSGDSFALTTAELVKPDLANNTKLLNSPQQPYANVTDKLEWQTVSNLICKAKPKRDDLVQKWGLNCQPPYKPASLTGKIVVVGAQSTTDQWAVLDKNMYGFQLQGHYIAALLGGAYLRDISPWWLLLCLAIYFTLGEILLPRMGVQKKTVFGVLHIHNALVWEFGLFVLAILIGIFVPLACGRFPPVAVLLIVAAIFVPRFLIEWLALLNEQRDEAEKELP